MPKILPSCWVNVECSTVGELAGASQLRAKPSWNCRSIYFSNLWKVVKETFRRTLWNSSIKLFCQTSEFCVKSLYKRQTKIFQVDQCSVKVIFAKKIFDFRFDELSAPFVKKTKLFIGSNFLTTKNGLWVSSKNRSSCDLFAPFISSFNFSSQSLVTVKISWLVFKTLLSFVIYLDMLVNFAFSSLLKEFLQKILRFLEHELKVLRYQLLIGCMVSMKLLSSFLLIFQLEIRLWTPIVLLFL